MIRVRRMEDLHVLEDVEPLDCKTLDWLTPVLPGLGTSSMPILGTKNARKMPKDKKCPKPPIFHVLWHFY